MKTEKMIKKILKILRPPIDKRDKELLIGAITLTQQNCVDEFSKRLKEEIGEKWVHKDNMTIRTIDIIDKIAKELKE